MTEDVGLPGKKLLIGANAFEISEPRPAEVVFADIYTELRVMNGVVHLTLASLIKEGDNPAELRVVSRIRMPEVTMANIVTDLQKIAADLAEAKKTAN